jgi:hypothetical protein
MTISTRDITDILGAPELNTKFDSTNYIDLFPVSEDDPLGGSSPDTGTITIQGVTFPTNLWASGEFKSYKFELSHSCDNGAGIQYQPHIRLFPVNDNAGTVEFTYEYFFLSVDGTTTAGGTCTITGTVVAGDKTANKGLYISCVIDATNVSGGDQIIGVLTREAGTYGSDVSVCEFGIHAPVNKTGFPIPLGA